MTIDVIESYHTHYTADIYSNKIVDDMNSTKC